MLRLKNNAYFYFGAFLVFLLFNRYILFAVTQNTLVHALLMRSGEQTIIGTFKGYAAGGSAIFSHLTFQDRSLSGSLLVSFHNAHMAVGDIYSIAGVLKMQCNNFECLQPSFFCSDCNLELVADTPGAFIVIRRWLINEFHENLSYSRAALALGIGFGIDQDFGSFFEKRFKYLGILHVVVASGFNVGLISSLSLNLMRLFFSFTKALYISFIVTFVYAAISGFTPPMLRALVMFGGWTISKRLGKKYYSLWWLFLSYFFILFLHPEWLLSISLLFSVFATLGMILFFNSFINLFSFLPKQIALGLSETLSAQVFLIPLLIYLGGFYSPLHILANTLLGFLVEIMSYFVILSALSLAVGERLFVLLASVVGALGDVFFLIVNVLYESFHY